MKLAARAGERRKLGQMLVERGWITGEQLIRAIQSQRALGGRIGTCLMEMDVLTEDHLLSTLSDQLAVPAAPVEQLRSIDDATLRLVPPRIAERYRAIPFASDRTSVKVATLDVDNLQLIDELAFCTDKKVVPHIANEVRVFEALHRYFGVECSRRYEHLLDRLNRSRYMWEESAKVLLHDSDPKIVWNEPHSVLGSDSRPLPLPSLPPPPPPPASPPAAAAKAVDAQTTEEHAVLVAEVPVDVSAELAAGGLVAEAKIEPDPENAGAAADSQPAPGEPLTIESLERRFADANDPQVVGEHALGFLAARFPRVVLFQVRSGNVRGWLAHGCDEQSVASFELPIDRPSVFLGLARDGEPHRGPLAPLPAHRRLHACMAGEAAAGCSVVPVRVRGHLACAIYADRGDQPLTDAAIADIERLARKMAMALELCILRNKILNP